MPYPDNYNSAIAPDRALTLDEREALREFETRQALEDALDDLTVETLSKALQLLANAGDACPHFTMNEEEMVERLMDRFWEEKHWNAAKESMSCTN